MRLKRIFDIFFALVALIVFFPIMIFIALLIYFRMGTPIFFEQQRVGKNNKIFRIIKFRTMLNKTEKKKTDKERLTRLGKFLRSTSLDELPTLWNVIKGDMSIVGPRPLLVEYLPLYTSEQARRHEVKPGITGWAQVNGRNAISWEEKFELDVWYVDNRTFWLDIKIIALTIKKVILREGINKKGEATMSKFKGSQ